LFQLFFLSFICGVLAELIYEGKGLEHRLKHESGSVSTTRGSHR